MKTHFLFALLFAALALSLHAAAELATNTIKFSDPTKPGALKIRIARGNLQVIGADVAEITVKSTSKTIDSQPRKDGLRVLGASSSYSLTEEKNVAILENVSDVRGGANADFRVVVPRGTAVSLSNSWGGDITCTDLAGDLDVKSLNGEIHLDRLSGAACVETTNGEISANIQQLQSGKTYSFTSMNGGVRVRVPAATQANVRLRTQNGTILTDFDEKALVTKLETLPRKNSARTSKRSDNARVSAPEVALNNEVGEAVQEAIKAGADAAREAAMVARDAMRIAADEMRAHNSGRNGDGTFAPLPPLPPLPPMTGGKIISGTLNGGGAEIQIATMNGDVTLQKLDEKK